MVVGVADGSDKDRERNAERAMTTLMMKKIKELAKTAEFDKEYDIGDGVTVCFTEPEGED